MEPHNAEDAKGEQDYCLCTFSSSATIKARA
jgi:hypothetical protein